MSAGLGRAVAHVRGSERALAVELLWVLRTRLSLIWTNPCSRGAAILSLGQI